MTKKERQEIAEAVKRDPSLRRVAEALGVPVVNGGWGAGDDPSLPLPSDPQERGRYLRGASDWGK